MVYRHIRGTEGHGCNRCVAPAAVAVAVAVAAATVTARARAIIRSLLPTTCFACLHCTLYILNLEISLDARLLLSPEAKHSIARRVPARLVAEPPPCYRAANHLL